MHRNYDKRSLYTPKLQSVLTRLDSLVDWERLNRTNPSSHMSLERVSCAPARSLLSRLSNPHASLSAIHITGSKGKGSVASILTAALLRAPFLCTAIGTYGSPHVERVNERIRINSKEIPDDDLANALTKVLDVRERLPTVEDATWFDVMSATAMVAFQRAQCGWGVVEVGMGGRLDSTNVLNAGVAVVTNIRNEHAETIGPTLEDIAYEKAGIIAPGADVVCGFAEDDPLARIFLDEAESKTPKASLVFCDRDDESILQHNLKMARAAMKAVARREGAEDVSEKELVPLEMATNAVRGLPARQEVFVVTADDGAGDIQVLLDGAHVPESVSLVFQEIGSGPPPVVVLGVGKDKDVEGICRTIHDIKATKVIATVAWKQELYVEPNVLCGVLRKTGATPVAVCQKAESALEEAIALASATGTSVVIIGSLHLAGRIRPELRRRQADRMAMLLEKRRRSLAS